MENSKANEAAAEPPLDCRVGRRCGTCKSWRKRDNYACKFNGPYGGGTDGVEGCKWMPKLPNGTELTGARFSASG